MDINVLISNPDFFADLIAMPEINGIYVEEERITPRRYEEMVEKAHALNKRMYLALPYVWNEAVEKSLDRNISAYNLAEGDGFLVRNLDELGILMQKNADGQKILDAGMYTWNTAAMKELESIGADAFTAPYELNRGELLSRGLDNTEVVIYGHYPMMVANNCLRLTTDKCVLDKKTTAATAHTSNVSDQKGTYSIFTLTDRTGATFPVVNRCRYCYNIIYNSVPTWLLDEKDFTSEGGAFNTRENSDKNAAGAVRFNFTIESRLQMLNILENYFKTNVSPSVKITRGHYRRGAE